MDLHRSRLPISDRPPGAYGRPAEAIRVDQRSASRKDTEAETTKSGRETNSPVSQSIAACSGLVGDSDPDCQRELERLGDRRFGGLACVPPSLAGRLGLFTCTMLFFLDHTIKKTSDHGPPSGLGPRRLPMVAMGQGRPCSGDAAVGLPAMWRWGFRRRHRRW